MKVPLQEKSTGEELQAKCPFVTMEQASDYLGLSKSTLYSYTSRNLIPFYKLHNRKIYFKLEELNKFIFNEANRVNTTAEIEEEAATGFLIGSRK